MASDLPLVLVQGVAKKYCSRLRTSLWYALLDIAAELRPGRARGSGLRRHEFWSLRDISFELRPGEALAVVGVNGAGKSTLLKMLNGLIKPDAGRITLRGRVGALIELGAGLDPVLSGRENIYVRAALLGYSRPQVAPLLPAMLDFAGLGEAIEMPVQFYSSGMAARLAFAVTVHLRPDVLLVDEVLAVGDMDFQRKCIHHMLAYLASGGAIVLVSHNPFHIQAVCQRGLLLDQGRVAFAGSGIETLDRYFAHQVELAAAAAATAAREHSGPVRPLVIHGIAIEAVGAARITPNVAARAVLTYEATHAVGQVGWAFYIWTNDELTCITGGLRLEPVDLPAGRHELRCAIPRLPLTAGDYRLKAAIFEVHSQQPLALLGFENPSDTLRVHGEANIEQNFQSMIRQLVTLPVEWGDAEPAAGQPVAQPRLSVPLL